MNAQPSYPMNTLRLVSFFLLVVGVILVTLALVQDLAGIKIFSEPPYLVGTGIAAVGAAMLAGFKQV